VKIAVASDDGRTISPYFGQADKYVIITIESGFVFIRETLLNTNHQDFKHDSLYGQYKGSDDDSGKGFGKQSQDNDKLIFETINDCQIVLSRSMGRGEYIGFHQMDIQPILTDIRDIDIAVHAVIQGSIKDHPEGLR
jgi:predicted Fe-Mo cluster-binding NifX family protein